MLTSFSRSFLELALDLIRSLFVFKCTSFSLMWFGLKWILIVLLMGSSGPAAYVVLLLMRVSPEGVVESILVIFLLFRGIKIPCMQRLWELFLPLNMPRVLASKSFSWKVILLCFVKFFFYANVVLWILRGKWINCIQICVGINFKISYIFKESNSCPDKLTNVDIDNKFLYIVMPPLS